MIQPASTLMPSSILRSGTIDLAKHQEPNASLVSPRSGIILVRSHLNRYASQYTLDKNATKTPPVFQDFATLMAFVLVKVQMRPAQIT